MSGNNTRMTIDELRCDPDSPVDREENNDNWQFGKDLKERKKEFPWEFDSDDKGANEPDNALEFDSQDPDNEDEIYYSKPVFPMYLCTRDSAITRDRDGNPIPYKNGTNDDLPDINVFIKTLLLKELNKKFHINHALTMEDFLELEK